MKPLFIVLCLALIVACQNEPKNYATLSGKITNPHPSKTLRVFNGSDFEKMITLDDDGSFNDTLKVEAGKYMFFDGNKYGQIYLKNNNESSFTLDTKMFDKSLVFTGDDADTNNFLIAATLLPKEYLSESLFDNLNKEEFLTAIENLKIAFNDLKVKYPSVDSVYIAESDNRIEKTITAHKNYFAAKVTMLETFPVGSPSPIFENYANYKGGKTSLSDFKGKYVYIDVWATWCGPCKREIPFLKQIEEKYHGKNIEFISISIDDARRTGRGDAKLAFTKWKDMVKDKALGGVQLFADKDWNSDFIQKYKINGIPRFILIDPNGNIVNANAPRPSSSSLVKLFETLEI